MNINQIMQIIPHRPPFLFVDKVLEISDQKIIAQKNVTMNEAFFLGHFPSEAVMPGVLIIEALAQAGAILILSSEKNKGKIAYFGAINNVRFKKKVLPGDILKLELELIKLKSRAGIGKGRAFVDNELVAEGELTFIIG